MILTSKKDCRYVIIRIKPYHFEINPLGDGGDKREAQIDEALTSAGFNIKDINVSTIGFQYSRWDKIRLFVKYYTNLSDIRREFSRSYGYFRPFREQLRISYYYDHIKHLPFIGESKTLLWSNTYPFLWFIPYLFKYKFGYRVLALPHNIESLVPGQTKDYFSKKNERWLYEELRYLSACDKVYCIALEDEWLLKLTNSNAEFLSYFPVKTLQLDLLKIRERRKYNTINHKEEIPSFLIMGSATNSPTYIGMKEILVFLAQNKAILDTCKFCIAGFGTEILKDFLVHKNAEFLGTVDNQKLEDLLVTCKAAIINQAASTGALTKIQEYLLAGVPIIMNHFSARSYHSREGIKIFRSLEELPGLLAEPAEIAAPVIIDPCIKLIQDIRKLIA